MSNTKGFYLNNDRGKKLYEKTILQYCKMIIIEIEKDPQQLSILLTKMNITKQEFNNFISLKKIGNICFYDTSLEILKMKKKI